MPRLQFRIATLILAALLAAFASAAGHAGPIEDGIAAYDRGDFQTARKKWEPLAKKGDATAQHNLALLYENGFGVEADVQEAMRWYRRAAEQDYVSSQLNLAIILDFGRGVEPDPAEAVKWYRKAAEGGDATAQNNLGVMLENGNGTKQDIAEAIEWYRKAADQDYAVAQNNLGVIYDNGRGVAQDYAEAIKWYRKAAEQGEDSAQNNLAVMLENGRGTKADLNEAFRRYKLSAAQGNSDAQKNLGVFYYTGRIAGRDFGQAAEWIGKSAASGSAGGEFMLGILHLRGEGVKKDLTEAARLFGRAAEQGDTAGQNAIGFMYLRGLGVRQDYAVAEGWFRKAIESGDAFAMQNLGSMHELGEGMKKDTDEALRLYRQAAAADPEMESAKADAARLEGRLSEAYELYRSYAAREGDAHSYAQMALMHETGIGAPKDEAEAIRLYALAAEEPDAPDFVAGNLARLQQRQAAQSGKALEAPPDDTAASSGAPAQSFANLPAKDVEDAPEVSAGKAVQNERRIALVLGNGAYQAVAPLPNPTNDARAMSAMLAAMGFEVIEGTDLDRASMERKIREFVRKASQNDVSLLFYAGHGIQVAGKNYLVPVDARVEDVSALDFELIDIDSITDYMGGTDKVGIILLDACRDNPLARSLARTLGKTRSADVSVGLAPMSSAGGGLLVGYATAPNDTASDGDGANSPFTTALLKFMPAPGLEIQQVMTRVKAEVIAATKNEQRPWHNSDLPREVFLAGVR